MRFSLNYFYLLCLLFAGIILLMSQAANGEDGGQNNDELDAMASNTTFDDEMPIFDSQYSFAREAVGQDHLHVTIHGPIQIHLFGILSRENDLAHLSMLRHNVQFCNVNFRDLDNFLGALDHAGIQLDEFFAVMSPCIRMELNAKSILPKRFFEADYVMQTPKMVLTNFGESIETLTREIGHEMLVNSRLSTWLLFRGEENQFGMTKKLEIKGGKLEIVDIFLKTLIHLFANGKLEGTNNFVLTLNGFALDSIGYRQFKTGEIFWLKKLADSVWELQHRGNYHWEEKNYGIEEENVQAIFEIDKFDF